MTWFTCTPHRFVGNQAFLDRESGLLCLGFRALGHDSRAVQLGPPMEDDLPEVLRASQSELESKEWWKETGANGVVFFSYGSPKYRPIADSIVEAGLKLVQVSDTHGVISPWADASSHLKTQWQHYWHGSIAERLLRTVASIPSSYLRHGLTRDPARVRMMLRGNYFCGATPQATERYQRMVRRLAGKPAQSQIRHLPIPVGFHFQWKDGCEKLNEVIAVGRWDSLQKRTPLLLETIRHVLSQGVGVVFRIFGNATLEMEDWRSNLPGEHRNHVVFEGKVPNLQLAEAYRRAKAILVSAAYEGCHNSSAEALCCGCSVVACRSPFLCALEWHASKESGTLSDSHTGMALGTALINELEAWNAGHRNSETISRDWIEVFHPDKVAKKILEMAAEEDGFQTHGPTR